MNQLSRFPVDKHKLAFVLAGISLSAASFFMAWTFYFRPDSKRPFGLFGLIDRYLGPDGVAGACVVFGVLFALGSLLVLSTAWGNRE
jgi:hypothetical protein